MHNVTKKEQVTLICPTEKVRCFSNAVCGGCFSDVSVIANYTLGRDSVVDASQMDAFGKGVLKINGFDNGCVLFTSVPQKYMAIDSSVHVTAFVTAGLGNASPLLPQQVYDEGRNEMTVHKTGTINVIVLIDVMLSDRALVDASATITKSVVVTLFDWSKKHLIDPPCVGTPTDGFAVACTKIGKPLKYCGIGTALGSEIAKSVNEATRKALIKAIRFKYPNFG